MSKRMRQTLLFLLAISCAGYILAQDIIVLTTGENIKDIEILNVLDSAITYNQHNNTQSIPKSDVMAIMYSDGRYEEIKHIKAIEDYDKYLFPVNSIKEYNEGYTMLIASGTQYNQASQQKEDYFLWIESEDDGGYNSFRKKNKDIYRQFMKSIRQASKEMRFYDVASHATAAYKQKKAEGANSEDACGALMETFVMATNNL